VGLALREGVGGSCREAGWWPCRTAVAGDVRNRSTARTVLDARRGEVYGGVYDAQWNLVQPEIVMPFPLWLETLPAGPGGIHSSGFEPFLADLAGTRFADAARVEAPKAWPGR